MVLDDKWWRLGARLSFLWVVGIGVVVGSSAAPALAADPAYGAYLAGECVTCHRADGAPHGIPVIAGMAVAPFVAAMEAYRDKRRPNEVMQTIAHPLLPSDIAALAAYFTALTPQAPR